MAGAAIKLEFLGGARGIPRFDRMRELMRDLSPAAPGVYEAIRVGDGGLQQEFAMQAEIGMSGTNPWARTHDFGTRRAPGRTLHDTGAYEAAWMGGAGSIERATTNSFAISVDRRMFPQASVFQAKTPTLMKPKKMGKRGRYAMFWALFFRYGIAFSNARLERGFLIRPRRVALNRRMMPRIKAAIRTYLLRESVAKAKAA